MILGYLIVPLIVYMIYIRYADGIFNC